MSFHTPSSEHVHNRSPDQNPPSHKRPTDRKSFSNNKNVSRGKLHESKLKENSDLSMGERGRTRSRDPDNGRNSDSDKNSDSYYSDDYDNTTYGSERSPTPSSKVQTPSVRGKAHKVMRSSTPVHNQAIRKVGPKHPLSKRGARWGFRSQSLNKDPPPKDIDLVTKRVLSARLLKINELRNELTEMQIRLDEQQKENKALRKLQFRQEKALNRFEDTENEISQLISRHNNEIRALRERLRKSQERERTTERKLKETEDELYRTNSSLQKLKKLSEDRHLPEREVLTQKLLLAEGRLDDRERKVKELEKNLELSQSSFQRQLLSERKKAHEAHEESKALREELLRLNQKLKEKERELDAKNIYAFRLSKPSPKRDMDITPRKKASNQNITTKSVQTSDSFPAEEFPPLSFILEDSEQKEREVHLRMQQEHLEKRQKEQADLLRQEQEWHERKREKEEKLRKEQEQQILEEKAQKLRDEWEKEEFDRKRKENILLLEKMEREERSKTEANAYKIENESQNFDKLDEERRKKEVLLAKMNEIDKEKDNVFYSDALIPKATSQTQHLNTSAKYDSAESKPRTYTFSEPTQNLFNGIPTHGNTESTTKAEVQGRRKNKATDPNTDLAFGSYAPSFGKVAGRSGAASQKSDISEENSVSNMDFGFPKEKDKKSNLMEQLFGANTIATTAPSKTNDSNLFVAGSGKVNNDASNILSWDRGSKVKVKEDPIFFSEGKSVNSNRHRMQHTTGRTAVRATDSLDDEIEEVAL